MAKNVSVVELSYPFILEYAAEAVPSVAVCAWRRGPATCVMCRRDFITQVTIFAFLSKSLHGEMHLQGRPT